MLAGTSRTNLRYIVESTFGTTPATPTMEALRLTGESLHYTIGNSSSNELRGDRNTLDLVQTSASAGGGFNFELSYSEYETMMEAALQGTWTQVGATDAYELKNGVVQRSFSIEKEFADAGQFLLYKGMVVNALNLNFASGAMVTGSIDFMGKNAVRSDTTAASSTTTSTVFNIMNAVSGVGTILEGGSALVGTFIKSATMSVGNKLRGQTALGVLGNAGIGSGSVDIKGSLEVYLASGTGAGSAGALYDKFVNGTASSFSLISSDAAGNKYTINFPKVKYSDARVVAGSRDADAMITLPFEALYDSGTSAAIVIIRDPI